MTSQPRIPHNMYPQLSVPPVGSWTPQAGVSVVIPAHGHQAKLDLTLASLAAQTYPEHLLEVIIVDDGSEPALRLPEIRPANTRLMPAPDEGWGSAHAVNAGVAVATHDILLRLDADLVVARDHVEAHARWHHAADYIVVVGDITFVSQGWESVDPKDAHVAVNEGRPASIFDPAHFSPSWVKAVYETTNNLLQLGCRPFRVGNGASLSFTRRMFRDAGGFDTSMPLGSDTEFSYRLAQVGAVFVPEHAAQSWHLGLSQMKRSNEQGRRFRTPYGLQRTPQERKLQSWHNPSYEIPYVNVVVDATGRTYEEVRASVLSALNGTLRDVSVTVVGPWNRLPTGRRNLLEDEMLDYGLLHETFRSDGRVHFALEPPEHSFPAPFTLRLPAGLALTFDGLRRLITDAETHQWGLVLLPFPRDPIMPIARLERTAAFARARTVRRSDEDIEDVVHELFGVHWMLADEYAIDDAEHVPPPPDVGKLAAEVEKLKALAERRKAQVEKVKADLAIWKARAQVPVATRVRSGIKRRVARWLHVSDGQ